MRTMMLSLLALLFAASAAAQDGASLFVLVYRQGPAWKAGEPMRAQTAIGAHGAYMKRLFGEGRSFAAGPTTDAPGGVVILRASSLEEARALMAADPGVSSGMFMGEVHAWTPVFRSDQPLPQAR
jgi:uncharacterized protein YciI